MSKEREVIDYLWEQALGRTGICTPGEARKIAAMIEEATDEARQEGWSDGYFEAGGFSDE